MNIQDQSIAVTGGAGFIGCHLVERLLANGAKRVLVIDSLEYGTRGNLGAIDDRISVFEHRLGAHSRPILTEQLSGYSLLFHLAAEKHNQSIDSPIKVIDANIAGTHELLAAAAEVGIRKVVFTSSLYAYGRMKGPPFVETEIPRPRTVYGTSKLAGEHLCHHIELRANMPCVALRYLFVYGPRQFARQGYKSVIVKNFERLLEGKAPLVCGDGKQQLDYVYVDDAVEATLRSMESTASDDVFNICTGRGISVLELTELMQQIAGTHHQPVFVPPDATHDSSRVGDPTKCHTKLGFKASVPLEEGLHRTFEWMKQQHRKV